MAIVGWSLGQICLLWRRSVAFILYCGNVDSEHGNNSNDNTRVQTIEWAVAVFSAVLSLSLSPQGRRLFSISPSVKPCWQDTRVLHSSSTSHRLLRYYSFLEYRFPLLHFCIEINVASNIKFTIKVSFFRNEKCLLLDLSQKLSSALFRILLILRNKVNFIVVTSSQASREIWYDPRSRCLFSFFRGCVHKTWDAKPVSIEMEHRHQRWSPCEAPAGSYWNQPPIVLDHCPPFHPSTKNLNHFQPLYRYFLRALTTPGFLRSHTLAGQAPPTERSSVYRVLLHESIKLIWFFFFFFYSWIHFWQIIFIIMYYNVWKFWKWTTGSRDSSEIRSLAKKTMLNGLNYSRFV